MFTLHFTGRALLLVLLQGLESQSSSRKMLPENVTFFAIRHNFLNINGLARVRALACTDPHNPVKFPSLDKCI